MSYSVEQQYDKQIVDELLPKSEPELKQIANRLGGYVLDTISREHAIDKQGLIEALSDTDSGQTFQIYSILKLTTDNSQACYSLEQMDELFS